MATGTAVDVVMPQMGVSVSEGTVTKWLKQEGDTVEADEALLEISTDKVDTEVPSPGTGVVQQILVAEGETVEWERCSRVIAPEGGGAAAPPPAEAPPEPATQEAADEAMAAGERGRRRRRRCRPSRRRPLRPRRRAPAARTRATAARARTAARSSRRWSRGSPPSTASTPQVAGHRPRRPRDEEGHPGLRRVRRLGAGSRSALRLRRRPSSRRRRPRRPQAAPAPTRHAPAELGHGETLEPMSAMRRGIAEHMRRSLDTAAHVTSAIEVDMSQDRRASARS